jgi:hypothetical protein
MKTMVLQLGQPLSWPGYELIMNEAYQEDHFFKTLVFHFFYDGAGWFISELINPKFFRKSSMYAGISPFSCVYLFLAHTMNIPQQ